MFKTVELGEVLNYEQPTRYIVESDIYNDEYDVPVLTAGKSFILGYTNEKENIYQNYPVIIFDDFTTATKYVDFPFKVKSSAMKILSCDENIADIKFLFYLIQTIKINSEQHQRYWISKFSKIQIPLPSLVTQKAIAEKLDKADALRKKDQELLKQYDELAQSIFIDMFGDPVQNEKGWDVDFLSSVAPFKKYDGNVKEVSGKYWLLNLDMVKSNTGEIISKNYVEKSEITNSTVSFNEEQVLYSKLRPYLNKVVLPNSSGYATSELVPMNPNKEVLNRIFLGYLLRSKSFVNYIEEKVAGAKMPRVNMDTLREYNVILPPFNLQNQFAEKIKNIEAQKELVKKQAEASENLFQALLQESFSFT
ncbi:restriction endonuclease subunit S [Empedobacter sp.]|uniref:restriction endonuclease subunit S n=1 Tax=Empedobacter sp. TaxID=1927715 RepID=UPI0028AFE5E5|nr:restriction endonuclease subunit S [Empedobacter sp.]